MRPLGQILRAPYRIGWTIYTKLISMLHPQHTGYYQIIAVFAIRLLISARVTPKLLAIMRYRSENDRLILTVVRWIGRLLHCTPGYY